MKKNYVETIRENATNNAIAVKGTLGFGSYRAGTLAKRTIEQLQTICEECGITFSVNDRKHELVYLISDYFEKCMKKSEIVNAIPVFVDNQIMYMVKIESDTTECDIISEKDGINLLYSVLLENERMDRLTRSIIHSFARSDKHFNGAIACFQIEQNNYRDAIVEDIRQEIAIIIMEHIRMHHIVISDGIMHFVRASWFTDLYNGLYFALKQYKSTDYQSVKFADFYDVTEDGELVPITLTDDNRIQCLAKIASIDDILHNDYIRRFFAYVDEHEPMRTKLTMAKMLSCLFKGYEIADILTVCSFSRATYFRYLDRVRVLKSEYDDTNNMSILENDNDNYGCTYRKSDDSASGSYQFKYNTNCLKYDNSIVDVLPVDYLGTFASVKEEAKKRKEEEEEKHSVHYIPTSSGKTLVFRDGKHVKTILNRLSAGKAIVIDIV